jgi:hypothetical protein
MSLPLVLFFLPLLLLGLSDPFRLLEIETGVAKIFWLDLEDEGDLAAEATEDMARREKVTKRAKEEVFMVADVVIICFCEETYRIWISKICEQIVGKDCWETSSRLGQFCAAVLPVEAVAGRRFPRAVLWYRKASAKTYGRHTKPPSK